MKRLLWTPVALEDLQGISRYIERQSSLSTANRVCRAIYDAAQTLKRFPDLGRIGLEAGTLELVVAEFPAYIVVYRLEAQQQVAILRIWHGAQQRV